MKSIEMTLNDLMLGGMTREQALEQCNLPPDWQPATFEPIQENRVSPVAHLVGNRAKRMAAKSNQRRAERKAKRLAAMRSTQRKGGR